MNLFRFIADMLHLAAILTLLYRIKVVRNCIGKSLPCSLFPSFPPLAARCPPEPVAKSEQSFGPGKGFRVNLAD